LAKHLQSKKDSSKSSSTHVFTALRKAANHALLLRTRHTSPEAVEHLSHQLYASGYFGFHATCTQALVKKELENFSDYDVHCAAAALIDENPHRKGELQRYLLQEEDLYCSPKFVRLKTMLPKLIREGHRILIFSQWTRVLDLLGCLLDTMETQFLRLDGQTTISERQTLIDQYTNDENIPVFLLSTRAGGMGINLTAADTCILHDLDFNPFNDIQAEDRVHRIGQKKPVTVIKMVTENTVDSDIYKMQERKAEMNAAILERKESTSETKGREKKEMNMIFEMAVNRYNSTST
jgi:SWI/SNF-related matrix-associated actin-dependent regulator 1 of chromatin subfamily A